MAGSGRRTFAPGEVLTASNVMNYLMDQSVMTFSGTAARGSAIGTAAAEGMVSYLTDTNLLEAYDGSAWKQIGGTTGSVLQVVTASKTDTFSTTSTSFTDVTGLSVSITPKSSNSKILVTVTSNATVVSNTAEHGGLLTVLRGSTNLVNASTPGSRSLAISKTNNQGLTAGAYYATPVNFTLLDSPATTSSTTYKVQAMSTGGATLYLNRLFTDTDDANSVRMISTITVMEIAG